MMITTFGVNHNHNSKPFIVDITMDINPFKKRLHAYAYLKSAYFFKRKFTTFSFEVLSMVQQNNVCLKFYICHI